MDIKTFDLGHIPPILQKCLSLNYKIFLNKNYDLNLIACRSPSRESGKFDDLFHVIYRMGDRYVQETYSCTTDAGLYWMHNPSRVEGTAILVPGQYRNAYKLDYHGGNKSHLALCQRGNTVQVYRDSNRDNILDHDPDSIQEGWFGINIHRASTSHVAENVHKYSAGCIVIQEIDDFNRLIALAKKQIDTLGYESFSLTLLED
tara:strand:+ start:1252 stop:1860 length:609 start_codon:yes stop_codon:yes gene_type:complete